jgi:hypothetical protein
MDIQTISITLAGIGVFIAALNSIISSRHAHKQRQTEIQTRQAELFMNVYNRWNSRDIQTGYGNLRHIFEWTDHQDFWEKYSIRKPYGSVDNFDSWLSYQTVLTYFEGVGMLVKDKLIDVDKVEDLFSERIIWFYETYLIKILDAGRKELGDPIMYDSIEYLYHEMKHRQRLTTRPEVK